MSLRALNWAMQLNIRPSTKKAVLIVLGDFAVESLKSYPSDALIQKTTGLTQAQIEYALNGLVDDKIIRDTGKRVGEANEIRVFQILPITEVKRINGRTKTTNPDMLKAEEIYKLYPRPVAKPKSLASIARVIKKYGFDFVKQRTEMFAATWKSRLDIHLCPHSNTFFFQERFADDPKVWSNTPNVKPINLGPKFTEVRAYVIEKVGTDERGWSSSFYNFWNHPKRNWTDKNGRQIDWKERLSKQLSIWRPSG